MATSTAGDSHGARPGAHDGAAVTRGLAAAWVARHVSRGATVSCDRAMCAVLAALGFPARNLRVLGPAAHHPPGSGVIVVTAAVRSQFGTSLGSQWAPAVIASFGLGAPRIDIRVIAPHGATAYKAAVRADQLRRKAAGSGLLAGPQMVVSATARRQLAAGQVDSRLLRVIAALVARQPIHILAFGSLAPGASTGTPLRFADLAETDPTAHLDGARYVGSMLTLLRAQKPPYRPAHTATVRLADGQTILRIEFDAPSPLGLLSPLTP
jgi:hypothetical protein